MTSREKLGQKIGQILSQAQEQRRPLTAEEKLLVTDFNNLVQDEMKQLPGRASTVGNWSSSSDGAFAHAGEQLAAIANAARPGSQTDPRLYNAASGANETVPSEGGFLLQQDFSNDIIRNIYAPGKLASLCRRIQISGNSNSLKINGIDETSRVTGSRWGGVRSYWVSEAALLTESKPKFRQIELLLKKQAVLIYCTDEMLSDSSVMASVLTAVAGDELSFQLEDAIVQGSGVGQPLGIMNGGSLISAPKEVGQKAGTLVLENVLKMWSRMIGSSRQNAVWLINQAIESQLYSMSLAVGTGGHGVFMPAGGASAQPYMTLMGRPIIPCESCSDLGTSGDIILASFQDGYLLAEKGGIQQDMSIHVRFLYDESVFRFIMRVDGSPVLSQPLTPFKGTATQSHFVSLVDRV